MLYSGFRDVHEGRHFRKKIYEFAPNLDHYSKTNITPGTLALRIAGDIGASLSAGQRMIFGFDLDLERICPRVALIYVILNDLRI